ncbi:MAG TPA: hypothetical protein VFH76_30915 [Kribbella sp.]|nr:hypothetical protein [Kribbella sp.]
MSWQLWVLIALAAAGLALLAVARMRHARKVFDDITELNRPAPHPAEPAAALEAEVDELAQARARHITHEPNPDRRHG